MITFLGRIIQSEYDQSLHEFIWETATYSQLTSIVKPYVYFNAVPWKWRPEPFDDDDGLKRLRYIATRVVYLMAMEIYPLAPQMYSLVIYPMPPAEDYDENLERRQEVLRNIASFQAMDTDDDGGVESIDFSADENDQDK